MVEKDEYIKGHQPIRKRINVQNELKRYRDDPMYPLIEKLEGYHKLKILEDDISMYQNTYYWFYLSLERFLPAMSLSVRWFKGPYGALREGRKFTNEERKIADKYNALSRFIYFDFYNCILYARILLDRIVSLSRLFLIENNKPSFTSFNDHKKFFKRLTSNYGSHQEYASYIREQTDWFDMPLKEVRDRFIVHASPKHLRSFGFPLGFNELSLFINIPTDSKSSKPLKQMHTIVISIPQLATQIYNFLIWFNDYALRKTPFKQMTIEKA
jgi:hypothetical protein